MGKWGFAWILPPILWVSALHPSLAASSSERATPPRIQESRGRVLARIEQASSQIRDLSAHVELQVRLSPPGLTVNASGEFYFKDPDRVKVKLRGIPEFLWARRGEASKTASILGGLRRNITRDYTARNLGEALLDGAPCFMFELVPKSDVGLTKILVWINVRNLTMPQAILIYGDGAVLTQKKHFVAADELFVVDSMDTTYDSGKTRVEIQARFVNLQVNKGVEDGVFDNQVSSAVNP